MNEMIDAMTNAVLDSIFGETRCGNCKWWDDTERICKFEGDDEANCFEARDKR